MQASFTDIVPVPQHPHSAANDVSLQDALVQLQAISSCIALVELALDGTIIFVNETALALTGYQTHEVVGKHQRLFFPAGYEDSEAFKTFARAVMNGDHFRTEVERICKDGSSVWFDFSCVRVRTSSGEKIICAGIDITARHKAEEELRYASTTLNTIWEHAADIIVMLDVQGTILFAAPSVERITGWKPEEMLGKKVFHFVHPDHRSATMEAFTRSVAEQRSIGTEYQWRTSADTYIWLETIALMQLPASENPRLLAIVRDITERKRMDEELRMKQLLLEEAQIVGRIGSWEFHLASRTVTWSDNMYRMLGVPSDEAITPERYYAFLYPDDEHALAQAIREAIEHGKGYDLPLRHKMPNGEMRFYQARGRVKRNRDGAVVALYGTLSDIHEIKMKERVLQESEARFRNIVEHSNEIIYTLALDGIITFVSPAWQELLGHTPESVTGKNFLEFLHADDVPAIMARMATVLHTGDSVRGLEYRVRHANGEWRWHRTSGSLVKSASGEAAYYAGIAQDVTERRQYHAQLESLNESLEQRVAERTAELERLNNELQTQLKERRRIEANLEHNELSLSALIEATDDSIWSIDADFAFTSFNTAFRQQSEKLYGVDIELGEDALDTFRASSMPRDEWNQWHDWYLHALRGEKFVIEHESHHQNGVAHFEISFNPVFNEDGETIAVVVFSRSIAERKRAEEEIRRALQQEKELGELKTRFVSMVSHEFRTPLTTIRSSAELLSRSRQKMTPEKQQSYFEDIDNAIKRMTLLLENVLFLGKAGANRIQLTPWATNIPEMARDVATEAERATIEYQPVAIGRVKLTLPPEALRENARMPIVDERLTRQILTNLLTNALKYSPAEQAVELDIKYISTHLLFEIRDKGIGIPPEDLKLLFEPFHRGDNVGIVPGTGLGMAIIKQSVDLLKGRISCQSTVNEGTTFVVEIPCTYI
jgi:PAS domain S-box-containing protein